MRLHRGAEGRTVVDLALKEKELERVTASGEMAQYLLVAAASHIHFASLIAETDPAGSYQLSYDGSRKALTTVPTAT